MTRSETHLEDPEGDINRYSFASWDGTGEYSLAKGFAPIASTQDSDVYGLWCSPSQRRIVEYAEHDLTIAACDTDDEFVNEVRTLQARNTRYGWGAEIDPGSNAKLRQHFVDLGLADLFHPATQRDANDVAGQDAALAGHRAPASHLGSSASAGAVGTQPDSSPATALIEPEVSEPDAGGASMPL
ncbi:hypothetical protein [Nocardia suismassiliense]|uniref:hypothetical protein n=1 Tax=Nocardia suismassiliense TaxID=2077092 RepID=UPI00131F0E51|nr:hypothetical protein [Nocardia suismassiliense]